MDTVLKNVVSRNNTFKVYYCGNNDAGRRVLQTTITFNFRSSHWVQKFIFETMSFKNMQEKKNNQFFQKFTP